VPDYPFITLRAVLGPETMLGGGKAALLQGIAETGSIAAAARAMGMSYKRAWYLMDTLNGYFHAPLVTSSKGGRGGGGAALTDMGRTVLELFRRLERHAAAAVGAELHELAALAATEPPPTP